MPKKIDRLYIGKGDRELYDNLAEEWIFRNKTRREQFLLAMAYGFKYNARREPEQTDEFFHLKDLRTEDYALIDALAVQAEGELELLADQERVFQIAQEYAHGGIQLLSTEIQSTSFGSSEKQLEKELYEIFSSFST
jgi:hypothetical protein